MSSASLSSLKYFAMLSASCVALMSGADLARAQTAKSSVPTPGSSTAQTDVKTRNPFFTTSTLPYQAPPFNLIQDSDYLPAFREGMKQHLAEVQRIAENKEPPSFDNMLVALERAGRLLDRVQETFSGVYQADSTPQLDRIQTEITPELTHHQDEIFLNDRLFGRIKALYDRRAQLGLSAEQAKLLDVYYNQFVHAGAQLSGQDKAVLRSLNTRIAELETAYAQRLVAAARDGALIVTDKKALEGLDEGTIAAASKDAEGRGLKGKWLLTLQNTVQQPALSALQNRKTREALFWQSWNRAEKGDGNDTRAIIAELAELRAKKASLFHYPDYASYVLYDQMAKTPEAVNRFMARLSPATLKAQRQEAAELQALIRKDAVKNGPDGGKSGDFMLQPWDWPYYAERLRQEKYALDEKEIRPYFELHHVLEDGVFYAASQLYGIRFVQRKDIPVYHPDVMVYEVFDQDNSPLGLIYFDYFKRDTKSGGAWMSNFVGQSTLLGTRPVIYNVANFTKAAVGQPQLISFDDVVTMFHEFGHALHGLFASQTYPTLSGTAVARDFVEFPSQFNENWALYPQVFAHYARHYQTGSAMPQTLVEKIRKAARFDQGYALGEIIAAAKLDMAWHSLPAAAPRQKVDVFEARSLAGMGLDTKDVPPRYRSSIFFHIWGNGYAAGYYAYLWTQMLDHDAFSWFVQHGGLTRANGQRFRDMILSRGNTLDYGAMFRSFYGKDPDIGPMLESRGLLSPGEMSPGEMSPSEMSPAENKE